MRINQRGGAIKVRNGEGGQHLRLLRHRHGPVGKHAGHGHTAVARFVNRHLILDGPGRPGNDRPKPPVVAVGGSVMRIMHLRRQRRADAHAARAFGIRAVGRVVNKHAVAAADLVGLPPEMQLAAGIEKLR